jgi:hypothetical protein
MVRTDLCQASGREDCRRLVEGDHRRDDIGRPRGWRHDDDDHAGAPGVAWALVLVGDVGDLLDGLDAGDAGHVVPAVVGDGVEAVPGCGRGAIGAARTIRVLSVFEGNCPNLNLAVS